MREVSKFVSVDDLLMIINKYLFAATWPGFELLLGIGTRHGIFARRFTRPKYFKHYRKGI